MASETKVSRQFVCIQEKTRTQQSSSDFKDQKKYEQVNLARHFRGDGQYGKSVPLVLTTKIYSKKSNKYKILNKQ